MERDLEDLWQQALKVGRLTVQSRRDSDGEFVYLRCVRDDGFGIVCTAATLPAALRGLVEWSHGGRYRVIVRNADASGDITHHDWYANERAAESAARELERYHPGKLVQFVPVR